MPEEASSPQTAPRSVPSCTTRVNRWHRLGHIPALTPESDAMSKDLKARGFRFVGSTICYAYMQAAGMVNDHEVSCFRHRPLRGKA